MIFHESCPAGCLALPRRDRSGGRSGPTSFSSGPATSRRRERLRRYVPDVERLRLALVEFPADDPERALRFWGGLLGVEMGDRVEGEGEGWQSRGSGPPIGVHARGQGPGDTVSLPYFDVDDLADALRRVQALGGSVIHPGERWAVCRDSEGSPFGLAARPR